jgi:hypothetical protein
LDGKASLLNIRWREVQDLTDSHAAPSHQLEYKPIPGVHGPEDNFIDGFLIDDVPLDSLWPLENLPDDGTITWVGKGGKTRIDAEVVERREYRVAVSLCRLFIGFCQGEEKFQNLLLGYAGQITLAKSR